jgi:BirA family biotin operon repressor/biotin-[acetyl-CoA-carboxylase] ligase
LSDRISWSIRRITKAESTQPIAKKLADEGAPNGTVVVADQQTSGRGRKSNVWSSPRGGLYMSMILRPTRYQGIEILPLVGALAVVEGVRRDTGVVPGIKWPNDVVIDGKKLSGIISEASFSGPKVEYAVLGIGVNCNFPAAALGEESQEATTLMDVLRVKVDLNLLREKILDAFEAHYLQWLGGFDDILMKNIKTSLRTIGKTVEVVVNGRTFVAKAEDISSSGALVVVEGNKRSSIRPENLERLRETG